MTFEAQDLTWDFREGRDLDGNKYSRWLLIHGSGRILACVACREVNDYCCHVYFYLTNEMDKEDWRFIDEDSAKKAVELEIAEYSKKQAVKISVESKEKVTVAG